jgi:F-type H+-transporting ATPase subunit delta
MSARENRREIAEVRSAIELSDDQKKRLADALGQATGKQVDVMVIVDPSVLGGIVAQIGDIVIDGSVRHRIAQLKETI